MTGMTTGWRPNGTTSTLSNTAYKPTPTIMDAKAPYLLPFSQYSPITIGQINAASNPPKANKFSQTSKSGGSSAMTNTITPIIPVTLMLSHFTRLCDAFGSI